MEEIAPTLPEGGAETNAIWYCNAIDDYVVGRTPAEAIKLAEVKVQDDYSKLAHIDSPTFVYDMLRASLSLKCPEYLDYLEVPPAANRK